MDPPAESPEVDSVGTEVAVVDNAPGEPEPVDAAAAAATEEAQDEAKPSLEDMYTTDVPQYESGEVEDLASLTNMTTDILVEEIRVRYSKDIIYTWVSDMLIAVNPFKQLGIYNEDQIKLYHKLRMRAELPPHIYTVADACYQNLFSQKKNQCAVISGESGAGKTESAKLIINHIIAHSTRISSRESNLEQQILQVNPLLEAFGNAQTVMNDNSSRFGKYTRLIFDASGAVLGVQLSEYLLEKSRVVEQGEAERNFHVFYYLFGLSDRDHLAIGDNPRQFNSLHGQLWDDNDTMLQELLTALDVVGFSKEDQQKLFAILAACLHLSNVTFEGDERSHVKDTGAMNEAARLLGVSGADLEQALTGLNTVTRGEHIRRHYKPDGAYDCRDALAKALYGSMFGWIVNSINQMLAPAVVDPELGDTYEIGVLDIFGFENFKSNSFEQLCIDLAHEQLQYFFNQHTFSLEQQEYELEGVDVQAVSFTDNDPLIQMFLGKPIGVLTLLDEEASFPNATDDSFVQKLNTHFAKNPFYEVIKMSRGHPAFGIKHFPGLVEYNATNFLEKNRDNLSGDIVGLMQDSTVSIVQDVFLGEILNTGQIRPRQSNEPLPPKAEGMNRVSRKSPTLSAQFKNSLAILIGRMRMCHPHFVRCIKPNEYQQAENYVTDFVRTQMSYTGVLEVVRIRQEGFAWRPTFQEFAARYKIVGHEVTKLDEVPLNLESCKKILEVAGVTPWMAGNSKLFLKYFHFDFMEQRLKKFFKDVVRTQSAVRRQFARKEYNKRLEQKRLEEEERRALEAMDEATRQRVLEERRKRDEEIMAAKLADKARVEEEARKAAELRAAKEAERLRKEQEAAEAEEATRALREQQAAAAARAAAELAAAETAEQQKKREEALRQAEELRREAERREAEMIQLRQAAEEARKAKEAAEEETRRTRLERTKSRKMRKQQAEEEARAAAERAAAEAKAAEEARQREAEARAAAKAAEDARKAEEARLQAEKEEAMRAKLEQMEEEARKAQELAEKEAKAAEEARLAQIQAEEEARKAEEERAAEEARLEKERLEEEVERLAADWTLPTFNLADRLKKLTNGKYNTVEVNVAARKATGYLKKIKATDYHSWMGFLKHGGRKNWKNRWFVADLDEKTLKYYETDKQKKLKNTVSLGDFVRAYAPNSSESREQHMFMIEARDRTYFCQANSVEAMHQWIAVLNLMAPQAPAGSPATARFSMLMGGPGSLSSVGSMGSVRSTSSSLRGTPRASMANA